MLTVSEGFAVNSDLGSSCVDVFLLYEQKDAGGRRLCAVAGSWSSGGTTGGIQRQHHHTRARASERRRIPEAGLRVSATEVLTIQLSKYPKTQKHSSSSRFTKTLAGKAEAHQ